MHLFKLAEISSNLPGPFACVSFHLHHGYVLRMCGKKNSLKCTRDTRADRRVHAYGKKRFDYSTCSVSLAAA
jgi:hypothetical protein